MAYSELTVTKGVTGPARGVVAMDLTDIQRLDFQLGGRNVLQVYLPSGVIREFDLDKTNVITCVITAGGNADWTINEP